MKAAVICVIGLLGSLVPAGAGPLLEGRVQLSSGQPVPGALVLLFDLTDLRAPPLAATTDGSGRFTLPLATLAGVLPERFELGVNYPNPFNPSTIIPYQLPVPMQVRLEVFNILGQRVTALVDGAQPAGFHTASWDATDAAGQAVGAGVYLYRLSGDGVQATRSMLLIDGQGGIPLGRGASTGSGGEAAEEAGATAPVYGLTVSAPGLVPCVDPAFRVTAGMAPLDLLLEAPGPGPSAKAATEGRILGDVDNTGSVNFFDALLVALYSRDSSIVMPNHGDISLGDVNADGQVDLSDAWAIAAWLNDPADPALPSGIGEPVGPAASLSPDPATVAFLDDGSWHRFTVEAGEPVAVVVNPAGTTPRLEITTRSGRGNYCPAEADDDASREDGQSLYLSGCSTGEATVELRRESDGTVLNTYTFAVTASPADLVVSVSVSDSTLTPGQSFLLSATVRNQGTGPSAATRLRYYRSSNRTISTRDARIGTDAVGALAAAATGAESIRLTAPSSEGTRYYGACVVGVRGESGGNNCSAGVRVRVEAGPTTGPAGDRTALVALYHATDGPNWTDSTNWLSDRPLGEWFGVTAFNGRVTRLSFSENQLSGPIPTELGDLTSLERLDLGHNQLVGEIPSELGQLANLERLDLEFNSLSGPIPSWLGTLENLTTLSLYSNQLSGPIPTELGDLTSLERLLRLGSNQLVGEIPSELGQLANLECLDLEINSLSGPIPSSLGTLENLTTLSLSSNQLSGPIPSELSKLANLTSLWLFQNQLSGPIPSWLGTLENLDVLHLGYNYLTGEIPSELGKLAKLISLNLGGNLLSGPVPPWLGKLTNLRLLNLHENRLTGEIPPELRKLTNLTKLTLHTNQLTGRIPPELGQLTSLTWLVLAENRLTGEIPPELGQLTKLTHLGFEGNAGLFGPLPVEFTSLPLEKFGLVGTQVCVPRAIQEWLGGIQRVSPYTHCRDPQWDALSALYDGTAGRSWTNKTNWASAAPVGEWYGVTTDASGRVTGLNLENNNLNGTLPPALGALANLRTLNLSLNAALSGPLPQTLTQLPLESLTLDGTRMCAPPQAEFRAWLNGISRRTGAALCTDTRVDYYALVELFNGTDGPNWTNKTNWASDAPLDEWHGVTTDAGGRVTELSLRENNLRGSVPPSLRQLNNLRDLNLSWNELTGEIPSELAQLANLSVLNLNVNQLTGEIPIELAELTHLTQLTLYGNQLTGAIPTELAQLSDLTNLSLGSNELTGGIPSELAELTKLTRLSLEWNPLTGTIPPELGQLTSLDGLVLFNSQLTGEIPPELGELTNLTELSLGWNELTGEIPSELGQLINLRDLDLERNQLTGVPRELGRLTRLRTLNLVDNELTGGIPSDLGQLTSLTELRLGRNRLDGGIPSGLGQLTNLTELRLDANQLTGEIPPELGQLTNLDNLRLERNQLTGGIPPQLGQLGQLSNLDLSSNQLVGSIPPELGDLGNLRSLNLAFNGALSGTLPEALTRLTLESLSLNETLLCPPGDADFQAWLFGIPSSRVPNCARTDGSTAYLTQAAQSLEYPVPLVAGEAALLRVFVTAGRHVEAAMPPVRATFYLDGAEAHTAEIGAQATSIPWQVSEGSLSHSANAVVPGSVVRPGLEMVVEIDPTGTLDPALGVATRLPPTGRTLLNVRSVPPFDLTLVPFLWEENPDRTVLTETEGLSPESDLFRLTRDLLPVRDFSLTVHEPVWTSVDPTSDADGQLFPETELIHAMEGASGYHMGIFRSEGQSGLRGIATTPGYTSLSILDANVIAHELGHNLSLPHSPGCGAGNPDPDYPYEDGSIGVWGYDFLNETLVSAGTSDLMTYCDRQWISDYSFAKALGYRSVSEAPRLAAAKSSSPPRGLLLWGGRSESGELFLEPAFVVGAQPVPPRLDGPYRLTGEDEDGDNLFSLAFGMPELGCGGRSGAFAFILPVEADWAGKLARVGLSGPEGVSILDGVEDPSAALLLDRRGKVRGILRDWAGAAGKPVAAPRALPEAGLEVLTSRGLPDSALWAR